MSCYVKIVINSRKSKIKCLLQRALEFFFADCQSSEYFFRICRTTKYKLEGNVARFFWKISIPAFFGEITDTMSQKHLQVNIEKYIALVIAGGLPDEEEQILLLGSLTSSKRN